MSERRVRLALGTLLVALLVGVMVVDHRLPRPLLVPVLALLLGAGALVEYGRLARLHVPEPVRRATLGAGLFLIVLPLVARPPLLPVGSGALALLGVPVAFAMPAVALLRLRWRTHVEPGDLPALAVAFTGILVVAMPLACLVALVQLPAGPLFGLAIVLGSKLNDMGGYLVGSTLGRHRLCPGISKGKTWEGAAGGAAAGIIGTVLLVMLVPPLSARIGFLEAVVLGALLAPATQLGDLVESVVKRAVGCKDSAPLIKSFGGVLDLVDSLIFAAPIGYAMGLAWLV